MEITWIRGHSGIVNNDIVDQMAKSAVTSGIDIGKDKIIPPSDLIRTFKIRLKEDWQQKYDNSLTGNRYKQIQPHIPTKPWFQSINNRYFIKNMCRIRTKHALYPQHKHRLGLSQSPECVCGEIGDLQHVILECSQYLSYIDSLYNELLSKGISLPINLDSILCKARLDVYLSIHNFVKNSRMSL
ncbi:hypothetical protein NQ314_008627 [Rhamnusium bicolor]|uniref:RNase H type-1 domain-containing protein n=1 Tax=Rhamnusium bicolor TaxID=1586634 RepID=A0AAV8Y780_9CUCU|nr:hypothetical protein NQ314_008627 [Rhamnusium bicolor]